MIGWAQSTFSVQCLPNLSPYSHPVKAINTTRGSTAIHKLCSGKTKRTLPYMWQKTKKNAPFHVWPWVIFWVFINWKLVPKQFPWMKSILVLYSYIIYGQASAEVTGQITTIFWKHANGILSVIHKKRALYAYVSFSKCFITSRLDNNDKSFKAKSCVQYLKIMLSLKQYLQTSATCF